MNMNCEQASRLISGRIDRTISAKEAEALERHLSECAACRREARDQEKLATAIAALPEPEAPASLGERLRQAVLDAENAPAQRPASPVFRILAVAATVLLAVCVASLAAELRAAHSESQRLTFALEAARRQAAIQAAQRSESEIIPTEGAVMEQLQAFRAVRDYMGRSLRWMASDGDQVELGMSGGSVKHLAVSEQENIVLNLEYREISPGKAPRVLSNPEFVLFPGDEVSVHFKGRSAGEPLLRYRVVAERLIGGRIRTEVSFANEAAAHQDVTASLTARTVLTPGEPALIGAGGDSGRRWELYLWGVARPVGYGGPHAGTGSL